MRPPLALVVTLAAGCATFDGPPEPSIQGDMQGQLTDPHAPIVLQFSKPVVASSLKVAIAPYRVDDEGNLGDEDSDPDTALDPIFSHDPTDGDTGGTSALSRDRTTLTITPDVILPVGAPLVLLVEPGLADDAGSVAHARRRLVFTYVSTLQCNAPAHVVRAGTYFFIASINKPISTHVHLYGVVSVEEATGKLKAHFSKAKRNPDPSRCPGLTCATGEVCSVYPMPSCVLPSSPAGSPDEYADYVPDPEPPTGFGFETTGCTADQDSATASFATAPVDVVVQNPMVTLRNAGLTASFTLDSDGALHGAGSLVADAVLLGTIDSGKGQGDLAARSIPDMDVPKGLPQP